MKKNVNYAAIQKEKRKKSMRACMRLSAGGRSKIYTHTPWKGEVGVGLGRHDRKIGTMGRQR